MSKSDELLKYLQSGNVVTGKIAMETFGLYRLSSYINRYRKSGHGIETNMKEENGVTFASYRYISKPKQK